MDINQIFNEAKSCTLRECIIDDKIYVWNHSGVIDNNSLDILADTNLLTDVFTKIDPIVFMGSINKQNTSVYNRVMNYICDILSDYDLTPREYPVVEAALAKLSISGDKPKSSNGNMLRNLLITGGLLLPLTGLLAKTYLNNNQSPDKPSVQSPDKPSVQSPDKPSVQSPDQTNNLTSQSSGLSIGLSMSSPSVSTEDTQSKSSYFPYLSSINKETVNTAIDTVSTIGLGASIYSISPILAGIGMTLGTLYTGYQGIQGYIYDYSIVKELNEIKSLFNVDKELRIKESWYEKDLQGDELNSRNKYIQK